MWEYVIFYIATLTIPGFLLIDIIGSKYHFQTGDEDGMVFLFFSRLVISVILSFIIISISYFFINMAFDIGSQMQLMVIISILYFAAVFIAWMIINLKAIRGNEQDR